MPLLSRRGRPASRAGFFSSERRRSQAARQRGKVERRGSPFKPARVLETMKGYGRLVEKLREKFGPTEHEITIEGRTARFTGREWSVLKEELERGPNERGRLSPEQKRELGSAMAKLRAAFARSKRPIR